MQVKIFSARGDAQKLEAHINQWLQSNSAVQISHIGQSHGCDTQNTFYTMISILVYGYLPREFSRVEGIWKRTWFARKPRVPYPPPPGAGVPPAPGIRILSKEGPQIG